MDPTPAWDGRQYPEYYTLLTRVIVAIAAVAVAFSVGNFIYNVYFHPLAAFPGPLLWRGSNIPKIISQIRGNIHFRMLEFHAQYGSVVRLAPGELTYTSAAAVTDIYGNPGGRKPMPPQSSLGSNEMDMFGATSFLWLESHREHLRHRKVLTRGLAGVGPVQEAVVSAHATRLMDRLRERARKGEVVDLWAWFNYYTFDIIGDLTFSEPFGCIDHGRFHPWISFIFSNLTNMMYAQIMATMGPVGTAARALVPRRILAQAGAHARATRDKVDRRLARQSGLLARPDIVSGLTPTLDTAAGISRNELYADAQIMVTAGSETSATLLAVAAYYLLRNPTKLAALQAEVRGAFGGAGDGAVTGAAVAGLPYLGAVVSESLRIHPPLPAGISRVVRAGTPLFSSSSAAGPVEIDGTLVAEGTVVQVPHWAAFHVAANFRDPWEFAPERWLGAPRYAADNRAVFHPFSYGPRNCIGRALAQLETRVCLARLVLGFDMELMHDSADWGRQKVYLLYEKRPLNVKLTDLSCRPEKQPGSR